MVFQLFGNETTLPPAGWHPEPQVRGTFSILSTSLLTLFLCVYTVIHTNVPEYEEDRKHGTLWHKLPNWVRPALAPGPWRKIGWMIMGILAPEIVAWNAFEQRRIVKETTKKVREHLGDEWTDTHSWFAFMGGFAFDIGNAQKPFFPQDRRRLTITPRGIEAIAEHWPHLLQQRSLTREQIRARGKADGLTKFLACWQATWFGVQCIFRLSSGLAITLLELNVFAHAICALLIYALWWDKPQNVVEPYVLATDDCLAAAATLCTFSYNLTKETTLDTGEVISDNLTTSLRPSEPSETSILLQGPVCIAVPVSSTAERDNPRQAIFRFKVGEVHWQLNDLSHFYAVSSRTRRGPGGLSYRLFSIDDRALERLQYHAAGFDYFWRTNVRSRCRDWAIDVADLDFTLNFSKSVPYVAALTLAGAIYGGLHALAFNATFPSDLEELFWRSSSLTVMVFGLGCPTPFFLLLHLYDKMDVPTISEMFKAAWLVMTSVFVGGSLLWYLFCRTYLVVECFISLGHLSPSHLAIPTWSLYIPHIS